MLLDLNDEESSFDLSFDSASETSFYILNLELLEKQTLIDSSRIKVHIQNNLNSPVKIKILIQNDAADIISETEENSVNAEEEEELYFDIPLFSEEEDGNCISFYIEGSLKDGNIIFDEINIVQ